MVDDFSRRAVVSNTLGRFDARQDNLVLDVRVGEVNGVTKCNDFDGKLGVVYGGGTKTITVCLCLAFIDCSGDNLFVGDFEFVFVVTDVKFDFLKMTITN